MKLPTENWKRGEPIYHTPPTLVGKHEWVCYVYEHSRFGKCVGWAWRRAAETVAGIDCLPEPWSRDSSWPTYNHNDGTYAGCPKTLRKIWDRYEPKIKSALGKPESIPETLFS